MNPASSGMTGSGGMLEVAVGYALSMVDVVTPPLLPRPTPCRGWDLGMLLRHAAESLATLTEGVGNGRISLHPAADAAGTSDPAQDFRDRARYLLDACDGGHGRSTITIGGCPITGGLMTAAGALEIAVHGWDISQACGQCRPIPDGLATDLLTVAPLLVTPDRHPLFAAPFSVHAAASPSDRLTAFLGRAP